MNFAKSQQKIVDLYINHNQESRLLIAGLQRGIFVQKLPNAYLQMPKIGSVADVYRKSVYSN